MTTQSNIYAGVAGYVGRPDEKGDVGVFRRSAAGGAVAARPAGPRDLHGR